MSLSSMIGVKINKPKKLLNLFEYFFSEDQGRYILEVKPNDIVKVKQILEVENIHHEAIGIAQKKFFEVENEVKLSVEELYNLNNKWYYNY